MPLPAEHLARLQALIARQPRILLGLVGPPGCGKSTVAEALAMALPAQVQVVPMDGFHLARSELVRLGRAHRKGAPDTFDSAGYAALLQRLRTQRADEIVYAPEFKRDIEEPIAGAIGVRPETPLVVTEGNYLLLRDGHWARVRALLDEVWFIDVDDALRQERLIERHVRFGRTPDEARAWVRDTDEPNARLIAACRDQADVILHHS
ncbi:MAG TPA: nucleoside/nucleotide kinase family protein [Albitalea sp.]|uniref:nucleoside/nucleotide kinase family protein n=1 Tax=Piscinibacter sp. TaxID=1903157 RepID=UPI002ED5944F